MSSYFRVFVLATLSLLAISARSEQEADKVVFGYLEANNYGGLVKEIDSGAINPTYVSPGGGTIVEILTTLGAERESKYLINKYWQQLQYVAPSIVTAACLNARLGVLELLISKGALDSSSGVESLLECIGHITKENEKKHNK